MLSAPLGRGAAWSSPPGPGPRPCSQLSWSQQAQQPAQKVWREEKQGALRREVGHVHLQVPASFFSSHYVLLVFPWSPRRPGPGPPWQLGGPPQEDCPWFLLSPTSPSNSGPSSCPYKVTIPREYQCPRAYETHRANGGTALTPQNTNVEKR